MDSPRIVAILRSLLTSLRLSDISSMLQFSGGEHACHAWPTGKGHCLYRSASMRALIDRLDSLYFVSRVDETDETLPLNLRRP